MKFDSSLFAGFLVTATMLLARVQVQGIESALAALVIEKGYGAMRAGSRATRSARR